MLLPVRVPYLVDCEQMLHFVGYRWPDAYWDLMSSEFYGEAEIEGVDFIYDRERTSFGAILPLVENSAKPIFAICLGLQMFNVHRGGTYIPGCLSAIRYASGSQ